MTSIVQPIDTDMHQPLRDAIAAGYVFEESEAEEPVEWSLDAVAIAVESETITHTTEVAAVPEIAARNVTFGLVVDIDPEQPAAAPAPVGHLVDYFDFDRFHALIPPCEIRLHNVALKSLRFNQEPQGINFTPATEHLFPDLPLHNTDIMTICDVDHDATGTGFRVIDWRRVQWSWQWMIAQLDAESMQVAVNGEDGTSGGIIGCTLMARSGSYDHTRCAVEGAAVRLPLWDFVIRRRDGSELRMKSSWTGTAVSCMSGPLPQVNTPARGVGQSAGHGTMCGYLQMQHNLKLRFNPQRRRIQPFNAA